MFSAQPAKVPDKYVLLVTYLFDGLQHMSLLQSDRHRAAGGDTEPSRLHTETDSEPDHDDKYVKRTSSVKRSLQRAMPTIFQPSLPVTTRY